MSHQQYHPRGPRCDHAFRKKKSSFWQTGPMMFPGNQDHMIRKWVKEVTPTFINPWCIHTTGIFYMYGNIQSSRGWYGEIWSFWFPALKKTPNQRLPQPRSFGNRKRPMKGYRNNPIGKATDQVFLPTTMAFRGKPEQWKKPWLVGLYRRLCYPGI